MAGERFLNLHKIQKCNIRYICDFLLDFVEGAYSPGSIIIPKFRKQIIIRDYNILTIPIIVII
jgi:hypothetical protein